MADESGEQQPVCPSAEEVLPLGRPIASPFIARPLLLPSFLPLLLLLLSPLLPPRLLFAPPMCVEEFCCWPWPGERQVGKEWDGGGRRGNSHGQ